MFDFITSAADGTAIPAGNYAIRFIRCWAAAAKLSGLGPTFNGLSPAQAELAKRIITEIETLEGVPATQLPQAKVDLYVKVIAEQVLEVASREFGVDENLGKRVLAEMRQTGVSATPETRI